MNCSPFHVTSEKFKFSESLQILTYLIVFPQWINLEPTAKAMTHLWTVIAAASCINTASVLSTPIAKPSKKEWIERARISIAALFFCCWTDSLFVELELVVRNEVDLSSFITNGKRRILNVYNLRFIT